MTLESPFTAEKEALKSPFAKEEKGIPGVVDVAGGVAETIAAGVAGMGMAAVEGLSGLSTMAVGKEYDKGATAAKDLMSPFAHLVEPTTRTGKAGMELLGKIPEAFHAAGEKTFEKTGSPLAGAGVEAALTGLTLGYGGKKVAPLKEASSRNKTTGEIVGHGDRHEEIFKEDPNFEQGFTDAEGVFHDRKVSLDIAKKTKQISKDQKLEHEVASSRDLEAEAKVHADKIVNVAQKFDKTIVTDEQLKQARDEYEKISALYEAEEAKWEDHKNAGLDYMNKYEGAREKAQVKYEHIEYAHEDSQHVRDTMHKNAYDEELARLKKLQPESGLHSGDLRKAAAIKKLNVPPTPTNHKELTDTLYAVEKGKLADQAEHNNIYRESNLSPESNEKIGKSFEDSSVTLTPEEVAAKKKYFEPQLEEAKHLTEKGMEEGYIEKVPIGEDFFPRHMLPASEEALAAMRKAGVIPEKSRWTKMKEAVGMVSKGDLGGFNPDVAKVPGHAEARSVFVAENARGERKVIQVKGNRVLEWKDNNARVFAKLDPIKPESIKVGKKFGAWEVKEGSVAEIEKDSPLRYNKDRQATLYHSLIELRQQARAHETMKNFMESDFFKANSHKIEAGKPLPEGYRVPKYLDKAPQLTGYAFPKRTAEIIEDFARVREPTLLTNLSGILIKNMMLIPIAHMWNEGMHLITTRGVTGWITPKGLGTFKKSVVPAIDEVLNQGPIFREILKEGGSILSTELQHNQVQDALFGKAVHEMVNGPAGKTLAKQLGKAPLEIYNAISKFSNQAMWVTRDAMYVQQIIEKKNMGMSTKEAIQHTERHMPNYRLPSRVGEKIPGTEQNLLGETTSRKLAEVLANPNLMIFSRYHHGYLSSLANVVVEAAGKGPQGKAGMAHGIDQALAVGLIMAAVYPLADEILKRITGNENAHQRRAGGYHLLDAIGSVVKGDKDPQAVVNAMVTINPVLASMVELGFNHKLYNGQPVYTLAGGPELMTKQIGEYMATRLPQVNNYQRATSDKGGGAGNWAAEQVLDAKLPTDKRVALDKEYQRKQRIKAMKLKQKYGISN